MALLSGQLPNGPHGNLENGACGHAVAEQECGRVAKTCPSCGIIRPFLSVATDYSDDGPNSWYFSAACCLGFLSGARVYGDIALA